MKIILNYKNKRLNLNVKTCNWLKMFKGLMFTCKEKARALLLFDFKRPRRMKIHSCFVFFPFIAIWLDDKNEIIDLKIVKPFRLRVIPKKSFTKLIEIPINKKYERVVEFFRHEISRR